MSHGTLSRRFVLSTVFSTLAVLAMLFVVATCRWGPNPSQNNAAQKRALPDPDASIAAAAGVDCSGGIGSKDRNHPFICVDPTSKSKDPSDTLYINHVQGRPGHPSSTPVRMWWEMTATSTRENLMVSFPDETCIKNLMCKGGHCSGIAKKPENGVSTTCNYTIMVGTTTIDPTIVVEPCCGG